MISKFILGLIVSACLSASAAAQVGQAPSPAQLIPAPSTGGGITFTPTDAQSAAPGYASGSFTVNIGSASPDRIVVIGMAHNTPSGNGTPQINGGAMTKAAGNSDTSKDVGLWYANVTAGTTASISYGTGSSGLSVVVGVLKGQSSGGGAASSNPVTYTAADVQPLSVFLTVPVGGIGIAVGGGGFGFGAPSFTWTGTTSGGGDEAAGNADSQIGMSHSISTGSVGLSSSVDLSYGGTMAAASWAP